MGQKKEHSNLIKEHLKKRDVTQTWLAKELGMSFSITNDYVCNPNNQTSPQSSKWRIHSVSHQKN